METKPLELDIRYFLGVGKVAFIIIVTGNHFAALTAILDYYKN